jgi:hypothetical protein
MNTCYIMFLNVHHESDIYRYAEVFCKRYIIRVCGFTDLFHGTATLALFFRLEVL